MISFINKVAPNYCYSSVKSKLRNEQKKVLNFTRGYFSLSSVKTRGRVLSATLDDAVKKDPDPGKVTVRHKLKRKKDDDDVNKIANDEKKEIDDNEEKDENDIEAQEKKENYEIETKEKEEDILNDKEGAQENPNPNSMRKFDEMKESRMNRNGLKLFRKFVIEI